MKIKTLHLLLCLLIIGAGWLAVEQTARTVPADDYDLKLAASELTAKAFALVREERLGRGIAIDPALDPNLTGLIGPSYSGITTTLGHLEAKRSTTNPNFAAIYVDCFTELGLKPGDRVAFNLSGSFPCGNIAALCAAEVMGLETVVMSSVGASSYGGNLPDFTYPEMEYLLYEAGILSRHSDYVSLGGGGDVGRDMDPEAREAILVRLEALGLERLLFEDVDENLGFRYDTYNAGGEVRCFVNVGGNMLSFAGSDAMIDVRGGIVTALPDSAGDRGLIQRFVGDGVPVVHMLNMRDLCVRYGLPIDPSPVPAPGEGGLYYTVRYYRLAAALIVGFGLAGLYYVGRRARVQEPTAAH